jgi:hypothetical protein
MMEMPVRASPASNARWIAAPAWKQRGVNVHRAAARDIEHRLRQDQSVGRDHHDVWLQRADLRVNRRIAQRRRLHHGNVPREGERLDRGRARGETSSRRPVGLGHDRGDTMSRREDRFQNAGGELRRAGEQDVHGLGLGCRSGAARAFEARAVYAVSRNCFCNFALMRCCFSRER